jgi:hypothetical protein
MQKKLLGIISVDFDATGQFTDHLFCIRQVLEKKMRVQRSSASALYTLQDGL